MKLSLANSSLCGFTQGPNPIHILDTVGAIRSCGFRYMDYCMAQYQIEENWQKEADLFRAKLEEHGMTAHQGHVPGLKPDPMSAECMGYYERAMRFCRRAGIPMLVVHPVAVKGNTREEFFQRNMNFYRSLIPMAEEIGTEVLIENIGNYADPFFLWNGGDLRRLVDMVDHPMFNACWDVGHANHYLKEDCDQYASIMALGEKLKAIHLHDNCGYFTDTRLHQRIDMHVMPFASSYCCVNFDAVLQGLVDVNYQGTFNFETDSPSRSRHRAPFVYKGEVVRKLERLSLDVWAAMNRGLYEIGKYMLETYGVFEE